MMSDHKFRAFIPALFIAMWIIASPLIAQTSSLLGVEFLEDDVNNVWARLYQIPDDSSFTVVVHSDTLTDFDAGIWENEIIQGTTAGFDAKKMILYDSEFNFLDFFEVNDDSWNTENIEPVKFSEEGWLTFIYSNHHFAVQSEYSKMLINVHESSVDTLYTLQDVGAFPNVYEPFEHYFYAVGYSFIESEWGGTNKFIAQVGDEVFFTPYMYLEQVVNETETIVTEPGHAGYLWTKVNVATGETTTIPVSGAPGNVINYFTLEGESPGTLFRLGNVRGNDVPLGPSGAHWLTTPGDSLYYMYLLKENTQGEQFWHARLYGYNDTFSDSAVLNIGVKNNILNLVEREGRIFVSYEFTFSGPNGDSLTYIDLFGDTTVSVDVVPDNSNFHQFSKAKSAIAKFTSSGVPLAELTAVRGYAGESPSIIGGAQPGYLFEVGGSMAWVHDYYSLADTVINYFLNTGSGEPVIQPVNLPAGMGVYILWLNDQLQITDQWLIPVLEPGNFFDPLNITNILPYGADTLLIQGSVSGTTNFDPAGQAPIHTFERREGFFAFYHAPEILSTPNIQRMLKFSLFPNPAGERVTIQGQSGKGKYTVYDMAGKYMTSGPLSGHGQTVIDVSKYPAGTYIIELITTEGRGNQKFVVE